MTIFAVLSFAAALALAYLLFSSKKDIAAVQGENKTLAENLSKANIQNAALEADLKNKTELAAQYSAEIKKLEEYSLAINKELTAYKQREAALQSDIKNIELMKTQQQEAFNALQNAAKEQFKNMADTLLKQKSDELKGANKEMLNPLSESLGKLQDRLAQMQSLNENLQQEASSLTKALTYNKIQGNFGEKALETTLQNCGLKEGQHYEKQVHFIDDDGDTKIPDFVINLPDSRYLIVDSKMSLTAYTQFINETDETKKKEYLKAHIKSIEDHIKDLASKKYQELKDLRGKSPDFVLMYAPLEYAYLVALEAKKDIGIFADKNKVAIVTASSIIPIINAIENLWRIMVTRKNMEEIIGTGKKIHSQVANFIDNMDKLGKQIDSAKASFSDAYVNLTGKTGVLYYSKKLESLGIKSSKQINYEELSSSSPIDDVLPMPEGK